MPFPWRGATAITLAFGFAVALPACSQSNVDSEPPPPSAERPVIKSEIELAAERSARISAGEVVPTSAPALETRPAEPRLPRPELLPRPSEPGAIQADILLVNNGTLSAAEVIYPLEPQLIKARQEQSASGFIDRARRLLKSESQRQVGSILVFDEAMASLSEEQRKMVTDTVTRVLNDRTAREFGGSSARLVAHLASHGLTLEQYKGMIERDLVVRQYTREKFSNQIVVRRDELLEFYRRNQEKFATPEVREFYMIVVTFDSFLPPGQTIKNVAAPVRAQAKLKATRRIREAHDALASRPFEEVAREFSTGPQAANGGAWGPIGKPLQAPYDEASKLVFTYGDGQYSEPIETALGWCIVRCGAITAAEQRTFMQAQDEIRSALMDERYMKLATDYYTKLADRATVSSLDAFVGAALLQVVQRMQDPVGPPAPQ